VGVTQTFDPARHREIDGKAKPGALVLVLSPETASEGCSRLKLAVLPL